MSDQTSIISLGVCTVWGCDNTAVEAKGRRLRLCEQHKTMPPYKRARDGHGFGHCEFCGCLTNANLRRCCDAGYRADGGRNT